MQRRKQHYFQIDAVIYRNIVMYIGDTRRIKPL